MWNYSPVATIRLYTWFQQHPRAPCHRSGGLTGHFLARRCQLSWLFCETFASGSRQDLYISSSRLLDAQGHIAIFGGFGLVRLRLLFRSFIAVLTADASVGALGTESERSLDALVAGTQDHGTDVVIKPDLQKVSQVLASNVILTARRQMGSILEIVMSLQLVSKEFQDRFGVAAQPFGNQVQVDDFSSQTHLCLADVMDLEGRHGWRSPVGAVTGGRVDNLLDLLHGINPDLLHFGGLDGRGAPWLFKRSVAPYPLRAAQCESSFAYTYSIVCRVQP